MKIRSIALIAPLFLVACNTGTSSQTQETLLKNPLYLERYAEQMVDTMVNLEIYEDPLLEDPAKKKVADTTKEYWLKEAKKSRKAQRLSSKGTLLTMKEYVVGEVMFTKDGTAVHFGPEFTTTPGPSVHAFLTTTVDPRDVEFPDPTAIDLGKITVPYGAQTIMLEEKVEEPIKYRTLVIWDTALGRLYGFAQLSPLY
jgi:hypothetical protein